MSSSRPPFESNFSCAANSSAFHSTHILSVMPSYLICAHGYVNKWFHSSYKIRVDEKLLKKHAQFAVAVSKVVISRQKLLKRCLSMRCFSQLASNNHIMRPD